MELWFVTNGGGIGEISVSSPPVEFLHLHCVVSCRWVASYAGNPDACVENPNAKRALTHSHTTNMLYAYGVMVRVLDNDRTFLMMDVIIARGEEGGIKRELPFVSIVHCTVMQLYYEVKNVHMDE
jgi:hypothetical protein